jgi:hypothetical protein
MKNVLLLNLKWDVQIHEKQASLHVPETLLRESLSLIYNTCFIDFEGLEIINYQNSTHFHAFTANGESKCSILKCLTHNNYLFSSLLASHCLKH